MKARLREEMCYDVKHGGGVPLSWVDVAEYGGKQKGNEVEDSLFGIRNARWLKCTPRLCGGRRRRVGGGFQLTLCSDMNKASKLWVE